MKHSILPLFAALLALSSGVPSVLRYQIEEEAEKESVGLLKFSYKNCMPVEQEKVVINKLSFLPDPLVFPGPLNVSFDVTFKETVDSPLKADVVLKKKVGSVWVKIPCIGNIGSCTYDDLCALLSNISECPSAFTSAGVPCKCPFKQGEYKLPPSQFNVESAVFPAGEYQGQANLTYNGAAIGCYDVMATFG